MKKKFPYYKQLYAKDCGPTCIKIIAKYYNKDISTDYLRQACETTRIGTNLENLSRASKIIGFRTLGVNLSLEELNQAPLPCILHWGKYHYVVLYNIDKESYYISDPARGLINYSQKDFLNNWIGQNATEETKGGIALLFEVTPEMYKNNFEKKDKRLSAAFFINYLKPHKRFLGQLFIGLIISSIIQVLFPFLTQSLIDVGIVNQDINFIYLILFAQLFLYLGKVSIEILRDWILLHIGTRIKVTMISDFIIKLMDLPISFFDTKLTGDILQRVEDHERIRILLTSSSLNLIFSSFNILIIGSILAFYNWSIFLVFALGSILYFLWFSIFLRKRGIVDTEMFFETSKDSSKIIELLDGMQEIKLNNAEERKRWGWEQIQVKLYKLDLKSLVINQYQNHGSDFINEVKNIVITIMAANLVVKGDLTLGMMLAIMYILGQLNLPVKLLLQFLRDIQDAKISFDRLSEITLKKGEHNIDNIDVKEIENNNELKISNLNFKYPGANKTIIENFNLTIKANKVTAIVGKSGSGKTTLLKLLLKFYEPSSGQISIGNTELNNISHLSWREHCGVVMQEGVLFDDTVRNNICLSDSFYEKERFKRAIEVSNLSDFIENSPLGLNTEIGKSGIGISSGEKQRILIARAIYKDPHLLFFDEATSSLDTENEKIIVSNLEKYYSSKTSIVIAHRLSTVKNADQIIVLEKGNIVEIGNHLELVRMKGVYFNLIKNQLELGK